MAIKQKTSTFAKTRKLKPERANDISVYTVYAILTLSTNN